jgi:acyl carrier protein
MMDQKTQSEVMKGIIQLIKKRLPSSLQENTLHNDLSLLSDGLGLDSVGVVELFCDLEEYYNIPFPPELIEDMPLTIGKLVNHVLTYPLR